MKGKDIELMKLGMFLQSMMLAMEHSKHKYDLKEILRKNNIEEYHDNNK